MPNFENIDLRAARTSRAYTRFTEEGTHEVTIMEWSHTVSRAKHDIFSGRVRVDVSNNIPVGAYKDVMMDLDDEFNLGVGKLKSFIIAASGWSESLDAGEIDKLTTQEWRDIMNLSVTQPVFIGLKIIVSCGYNLRKEPRKLAKTDPTLYDNADWVRKNSALIETFSFHPETRAKNAVAK